MVTVIASADPTRAAAAEARGELGVALFHAGHDALAGLGNQLLDAVPRRLPMMPSQSAWDFLSLALAVFAADRFVLRRSTDGWTRMISLEVDVVQPDVWNPQARVLASTLRFLTGDIWSVRFRGGGVPVPCFDPSLSDRDCACLFSGGMDSLIGAADLVHAGRRPLLVSQASPKEAGPQEYLAIQLGLRDYRFDGRVREKFRPPYEPSSRGRSILFIAYGVLAASALPRRLGRPAELIIPENGLISINPPLTLRRIGSLSTRTTHPHFLASLQAVLNSVGTGVTFHNPYRGATKGEMLATCRHAAALRYMQHSYSCGKGKRLNMHCGRCVPCLIRRAAFCRAGVNDRTQYAPQAVDLGNQSRNDDVFAARLATAASVTRNVERWASESGPLPLDPAERALHVGAVERGLGELRNYFSTVAWR